MSVLRSALAYFGLVFGAGFALGTVRTLWLVPVLGERWAELAETPLMLGVVFLSARFVAGRARERGRPARLAIGALALALLVLAELGVVLFVRGQSVADYVASRDPMSGSAYVVSLVLFAVAPALLGARSRRDAGSG